MSLILNSRPLVVIPELAEAIGLNEAIIIQQIHYWCSDGRSTIQHDGLNWVYNTYEQWQEQFPFFSDRTIRRALKSLQDQGLVFVEQLNKSRHDRTNFYSVNYDQIESVSEAVSNRPNWPHPQGQSGRISTETTTNTTTDNKPVRKRTTKPEAFKQFFAQYPEHRKGGTDSAAWKKWKAEKLTEQDAEKALAWIIRANSKPGWSENRFVMGITNFIGQRMWLTDVEKIANEISTAGSQTGPKQKLTPVEQVRAANAAARAEREAAQRQPRAAPVGSGVGMGADGGYVRGSVDQQTGAKMPVIELDGGDWEIQ